MSARDGSRTAAVPPAGYKPRPRLAADGAARVRFVPEDPASPAVDFDFATWSVSADLQLAFARGFAARSRSGGPIRTRSSADSAFRMVRRFANYLAGLNRPPHSAAQLTPAHVKGWLLARQDRRGVSAELALLKTNLRKVPGVSSDFAAYLAERNPPRQQTRIASYSRGEFARILNAARHDVRQAAERIRANRAALDRWRAGEIAEESRDVWLRGRLLDLVDRSGDVPRYPNKPKQPLRWVFGLGTVDQHLTALHLSAHEAAAFIILLVGLTGQNRATILNAPAAHHRPDGYDGGPATAVVELDKPRRGRLRHMDVALVDLPLWAPAPAVDVDPGVSGNNLRTPFGVYTLLHELAAPARQSLGSDKLLAWWAKTGSAGVGRGFKTGLTAEQVTAWARPHSLLVDASLQGSGQQPQRLDVTLQRLRLTFNELHQRPVAHTETTLANEYLARNRGNIAEYQHVVADALAQQVAKAATRDRVGTLSADDIAEAADHPARVAARYGMDAGTLKRLLAGTLDTVIGGCVDNTNGPHTPGQACRASFMLCLSCPCARATPQHLPMQVLVHDGITARRAGMTPLRWAQRFALPHAQLGDLLKRAGHVAVGDARAAATLTDQRLVDRFLNRELDLP